MSENKNNNTEVRNCLGCRHYKNYKEDLYACEEWECNFEPREEVTK